MKYACPNCHKNEDIIETVASYTDYRGKFNEHGEIDSPDGDCGDSFTEYYFCVSCQTEFQQPEEIEDTK